MPITKAIGIDLGTSNSCVGVFHNGAVQILNNNYGQATTPSIVGFVNGEKKIGREAKNRMHKYPKNIVTCVKRLIGRKFNDPKVQEDIKKLPYKIVEKAGGAAVEITDNGKTVIYSPEIISAMVLLEMKRTAINFLGGNMKDTVGVVITIPAYFNDSQRQATIDAAKGAGLSVLRIINEPTAAALAYGYNEKWKNGILLVYDLGGGTFDVSIIKVTNGCCEVLAVDGDDHLGGEDFDNVLVKYGINQFLDSTGYDISKKPEAISKLKSECEETKKCLSNEICGSMEVDDLYAGKDLLLKVHRRQFNILAKPLIQKTLEPVQRTLIKAKISKSEISSVILVGGSTKIPLIRSTLSEFFGNDSLKFDIKADEAVAYGATLMAAHLIKDCDTSIRNIRLLDVIPRSLGTDLYNDVEDKNGYFNIVAEQNSRFPFEMKSCCTTLHQNQDEMDFIVYEGESTVPEMNNKLGTFTLKNIAPACQDVPRIEISFKVDENAVLTVSAVDKRNGTSDVIEIRPDKGRLSDKEIVDMIYELQLLDVIEIDDCIFVL